MVKAPGPRMGVGVQTQIAAAGIILQSTHMRALTCSRRPGYIHCLAGIVAQAQGGEWRDAKRDTSIIQKGVRGEWQMQSLASPRLR